jgi:hypothetical protein
VICSSQQAAIQAHELAFDLTKKLQGRQRLKLQLVSEHLWEQPDNCNQLRIETLKIFFIVTKGSSQG